MEIIQLSNRRNEKNLERTIGEFRANLRETVHGDIDHRKQLDVLKKRLEKSDSGLSKEDVSGTYSEYQKDALKMLGEALRTFYITRNSESSDMLDLSSWFVKFLKVSDFEYIDTVLGNTPTGYRGKELTDQIEEKSLKADELTSLLTKYDLGESDGKNIFIEGRTWITLDNPPLNWQAFEILLADLKEKGVDLQEVSYCGGGPNNISNYHFTVPGKQLERTYQFLSETRAEHNGGRRLIDYLEGDKKSENDGQKVYEINSTGRVTRLENSIISIAPKQKNSQSPQQRVYEFGQDNDPNSLTTKIYGIYAGAHLFLKRKKQNLIDRINNYFGN